MQEIITFIKSMYPGQDTIALHEPTFGGNEKKYVVDAIESTIVSSSGVFVDRFEEMIAKLSQSKRAVAVVNGTAALHLALRLAGVREGDEVLTQALTFVATANAITYLKAEPIFLDVDLDTMGLSPKAVEIFLDQVGEIREDGCYNKQSGKRISACVPMHTFGFPVHLDDLIKVCNKWKIPVVEDAAESLGSLYKNKPTGGFGHLGIYSFNGNKIVTSGGGGAIVTNDKEMGDHAKHLSTTAKKPHPYEFIHNDVGYNYRMPNLNAALACAQLEQIDLFLKKKRDLATKYALFFTKKGIKFRTELPETKANYWLMCVELEDKNERDNFLKVTNDSNIYTRPIWRLMFRLPMYKDCYRDSQKNARYLQDRIVNIPSSVRDGEN